MAQKMAAVNEGDDSGKLDAAQIQQMLTDQLGEFDGTINNQIDKLKKELEALKN